MTAAQVRVEQCDRDMTHSIWDNLCALSAGKQMEALDEAFARHRLATAAAPGVPEGWKLVPEKTTTDMIRAAATADADEEQYTYNAIWSAMLSAAPTPPTTHQGGAAEMREAVIQDAVAAINARIADHPEPRSEEEWQYVWGLEFALNAIRNLPLPAAEAPQGWRDVADLTDDDGYVLGWSHRDDGCDGRSWFIGRRYDMRHDALLNEWTGKWRMIERWMPLPAAPSILREGEEA